jgi:hypothetical protein
LRLLPQLRLIALAAALPLAACEHGIDLQGQVSVPAQVQQMFSAQHPGELVVTAKIPGQPDITAPSVILCEPQSGDRVIDVKTLKLGCARDDTALISAWIIPRTANEVSCSAPPPRSRSAEAPQSADAVAVGRTVVPVNVATMDASSCKDGSISFALTLAPARSPERK